MMSSIEEKKIEEYLKNKENNGFSNCSISR